MESEDDPRSAPPFRSAPVGALPVGRLAAIVESFVAESVRRQGPRAVEQARLTVWSCLLLLAADLAFFPVVLITYGGWSRTSTLQVAEAALCLGLPFVLKRTGRVEEVALAVAAQLGFIFAISSLRQGGLGAVNMVAWPYVPLLAAFLGGRRVALAAGAGSIGWLIVLFVLHRNGWPFAGYAEGQRETLGAVAAAIVCCAVIGVSWLFEASRTRASDLLAAANDELRRTGREFEASRDRAQALSRAKSEFLARVSHELRTPVHGVLGMNELLLDSELDGEQREHASAIRKSAEALVAVVDDLLDFSAIEAGRASLKDVRWDPREPVDDTVRMLAVPAQRKCLELVGVVDPDLPPALRGDPDRVRQVLINLVGNAIKYTDRGWVEVRASRRGDRLCFDVADTGPGVAGEPSAIFEPFTQGSVFSTRKHGGLGLGLAICRDLVRLMRGSIATAARPGGGSVFTVDLPLRADPDAPALPPLRMDGKRALVLDPSPRSAAALAAPLRFGGATVDIAETGHEAIGWMEAAINEGRAYHLAVLDLRAPGIDGLEVAARMAQSPALRRTPVLLVSPLGQSIETSRLTGLLVERIGRPVLTRHVDRALRALFRVSGPNLSLSSSSYVGPAMRRGRLLVVDDNQVARDLASQVLRRLGYEVMLAADGFEAVEASSRDAFDVILMDCQMPGMNGYEAAQEIRRREQLPGATRIVAVTAHAVDDERERCLASGMDDWLPKPFLPEQLAALVGRWVKEAKGTRKAAAGGEGR